MSRRHVEKRGVKDAPPTLQVNDVIYYAARSRRLHRRKEFRLVVRKHGKIRRRRKNGSLAGLHGDIFYDVSLKGASVSRNVRTYARMTV